MKFLFLATILFSSSVFAQASHWNYSAPQGPFQWGSIPGNEMCGIGTSQSPVDIETGKVAGIINTTPDATLSPLNLAWKNSFSHVQYNGHTIQVNYDQGSGIIYEGRGFDLKQFHFHSPSEHILDGKQYPLEIHFVHQSENGILVVGVFFEEGEENDQLNAIWKSAPIEETTNHSELIVKAQALLPKNLSYYHYEGSLTTPPCSENVNWIVLKQPIKASGEQLRFLQQRLGGPNNRPIQPQDGRMIGVEGI